MSLLSMPDYPIWLRPSQNPIGMLRVGDGRPRCFASSYPSSRSTQARKPNYWLYIRSTFCISHPLCDSSFYQCVGIYQCSSNTECRLPSDSHTWLAKLTNRGYSYTFKWCIQEQYQRASPINNSFQGWPNGTFSSAWRKRDSADESVSTRL